MPRKKPKRFTVTLPRGAYGRLKTLAETQEPPLTLQYLIGRAVNDLLAKAEYRRVVSSVRIAKRGSISRG